MARRANRDKLYSGELSDFKGYLKIPRLVLYYMIYGEKEDWRVKAFVDLTNMLTCKASVDMVSKTVIPLEENEKRLGNTFLSNRWGVSVGAVRFFIEQLINVGYISKRIVRVKKKDYCVYKKTIMLVITTTNPTQNPIKDLQPTENKQDTKKTNPTQNPINNPITSPNLTKITKEKKEEGNSENLTDEERRLKVLVERKEDFKKYLQENGRGFLDFNVIKTKWFELKGFGEDDIEIAVDTMFNFYQKSENDKMQERLSHTNEKKITYLASWMQNKYSQSLKKTELERKEEKEQRQKTYKKTLEAKFRIKKKNPTPTTNYFLRESVLNLPLEERFSQIDSLPLEYKKERFKELVLLMNFTGKQNANRMLEQNKLTKQEMYNRILAKCQSNSVNFDKAYRKKFFYVSVSFFNQFEPSPTAQRA